MKTSHCLFIYVCLSVGQVSAQIGPIDALLGEYRSLPLQAQSEHLQEALGAASGSDRRVIEMLLADVKYALEKRQVASRMLSLAQDRLAAMPGDGESVYAREAIRHDAFLVLQAIPYGWLSLADQKKLESLVEGLQATMDEGAAGAVSPEQPALAEATETPSASIDLAVATINGALELAQKEDLSVIAEAQPNGTLKDALAKCDSAREMLMLLAPDFSGVSRSRWEAAMAHLGKAVTAIRERQRLKYAVWAEGRYRDTDPGNVSGKLDETRAIAFYRRLSEVNVSLVAEPSLSREITRRLYELYDSLDTLKGKESVRYQAIKSLDKRRTLDDF